MDLLLPLGLSLIMFSLGVSLQPADFRRVFSQPRAIGIGLFVQIICLPLLAFGLLKIFGVSGEMAVGVMILSACPGGVSAGLLTLLAGGETALSISLTAITSLGVLITLPATVGLAMSYFAGTESVLHMPVMRTGGGVFLMTLFPVLIGMLFRQFRAGVAKRFEKSLARLSTFLFIAIVVATFIAQREVIVANLQTLGPLLLVLNVLIMVLGSVAAGFSGLGRRVQIALAMECGLHNAALGIFVANVLIQVPALAAPSVVYAFLMNITAIALVLHQKKRASR